ncbi:MAG: GldM family protein [Bacteroidota bacterium]
MNRSILLLLLFQTTALLHAQDDCMATVEPTRMNVIYIGVDNPILIHNAIAPIQFDTDSISGLQVIDDSNQVYDSLRYVIRANRPGQFNLKAEDANGKDFTYVFRVKRIPDPVPVLATQSSGSMKTGLFKAQGGVGMRLSGFDFDTRCSCEGFLLTRIPLEGERATAVNKGPRFADDARALMNLGEPGDIYIFTNVRTRCPGDPAARKVGSMVFTLR